MTDRNVLDQSRFALSPIALWEEDFSLVKAHFETLAGQGASDFSLYFSTHPEAVAHCATLVRIIDVNQETLSLLDARNKAEFHQGLPAIFPPAALEVFRDELIALASGALEFESQTLQLTFKGEEKRIALKLRVAPGHEASLSRILVSTFDLSPIVQLDQERLSHLWFLQNLERFNQAIRHEENLEQLVNAALDATLEIFDCDRAWVLYPCDPEQPSYRIPMERTKENFPGACALGIDLPMRPDAKDVFESALASEDPIAYDPSSGRPVPMEEEFSIRSQLVLAIHPRKGSPWCFGMHQCTHARIWSDEEKRLFTAIGQRVADALGMVLLLEELRQSQEHLKKQHLLLEETICQRTEQLERAKEQAEAASLAKGRFLANMSHELRTPLNTILGFSDVISQDACLPTAHHKDLALIKSSGEHLLCLINQILDLSKIEEGQCTLDESSFSLPHLLLELTEIFSCLAKAKSLEFRLEQKGALPQQVRADQTKLRQILINLLGNAVKYTERGSIALRVLPSHESAKQWSLRFEIRDTGPGIGIQDQVSIFDAFAQAETARKSLGTGLGLSISRQYARLMGGEVGVSSQVGVGSVFWFEVPLLESEQNTECLGHTGTQEKDAREDLENCRILVADDAEGNRLLLLRLLQNFGGGNPLTPEIRLVSNGQEAVEMWKQWRPHLILMDMRMPVLDGCGATQAIRNLEQLESPAVRTPIIALTANAFKEQRQEMLQCGCDEILAKPFKKSELFTLLHQYASGHPR